MFVIRFSIFFYFPRGVWCTHTNSNSNNNTESTSRILWNIIKNNQKCTRTERMKAWMEWNCAKIVEFRCVSVYIDAKYVFVDVVQRKKNVCYKICCLFIVQIAQNVTSKYDFLRSSPCSYAKDDRCVNPKQQQQPIERITLFLAAILSRNSGKVPMISDAPP